MPKIQNPTLYVFIGEAAATADSILKEAVATHPAGGTTHVCLNALHDVDKLIRAAKVKIQMQETTLNMHRANIYVIVNAHQPQAAPLTLAAGGKLRTQFAEDFAAFHITLAVMLSESNETDDNLPYETRNKTTYAFLQALTGDTAYDRIFLLSDRNEHGRVSPTNHKNTYKLLAYLPLLHVLDTQFDNIVTTKAREHGHVLFASAGLGEEPPQNCGIFNNHTNQKLHSVAQILETEISKKTQLANDFFIPSFNRDAQIIADITSVAAKPLSFMDFRGASIKEAESMLFGDGAAQFYEKEFANMPPNIDTCEMQISLSNAAAEEAQLGRLLDELAGDISHLENSLEQKEKAPVPLGFLRVVDSVKDAIGECYAIKYKLDNLHVVHTQLTARHIQLTEYLAHIRDVIDKLNALPITTSKTYEQSLITAHENAVLNISLRRDDGLIHERHVIDTPQIPLVLRIVGGFTLEDLTRYHALKSFST